MRRREFLLAAGAVGAAGTIGSLAAAADAVEVRWWATRRAVAHDDLRQRVTGYLERVFDDVDLAVTVSHGGVVNTATEDAYRLVIDGEWPRRLLGTVGRAGARGPVGGVNLLVTDGSMLEAPTGAGVPSLAAVGGARYLSRLPPADAVPAVVPDDLRMRTVQILVHEVGHGLGLRHDHGTIHADDAAAVVSPMVSGYAWTTGPVGRRGFDYEYDRCGRRYPSVAGREPWLRLPFDDCERRGIRKYRRLDAPTSIPESPIGPPAETAERVCPGLACEGWTGAAGGRPTGGVDGTAGRVPPDDGADSAGGHGGCDPDGR